MRKTIPGALLLFFLLSVFVGTAGAVSPQAGEDLILTIPNQDLGLNANVTKAPRVRLARNGQVFPLTVTGFVPGADGQVTCSVPSGLTAGHYYLWVLKGGKWVNLQTLVKVFAPVVNTVTVAGDAIATSALVTLDGLFFSEIPAIFIHYEDSELQPVVQTCTIQGSASVMDTATGASEVQVQIPDLGSNAPTSCVFEVRDQNGSAFVEYANGDGAVIKRGRLIGRSWQNTIKKKDIWDHLLASMAGDDTFKQIASAALLSRTNLWNQHYKYDLEEWNISYWTQDTTGAYVVASGVIIVPEGVTQLPLLSFQHGTMMMKNEAPTLSFGAELGFATTFATTDGFLISVPDHLGLGQASYQMQMNMLHPYCQAGPLGIASADMLLAVKSFMGKQFPNLQLKQKLFLAGYSEGGYATMALHRELDMNTYDLPAVTAAAYLDGPYSLSKVMLDKLMANQPFPVLYFAPYLLVALDRTYNIYGDASEYMAFPYDMSVAPLITGYFSGATVDSQMPPIPRNVLLPSVASQLTGYQGPIYDALLTNDLVPPTPSGGSWKPLGQIDVIHGQTDDCVPSDNLTLARLYFNAVGAPNVTYDSFYTFWANKVPYTTTHVVYCPFAMGRAWKWFHKMAP